MGGFFHFFDFNQGSMARKILAHKKHADGLEAPRNSLELQVEPSQSCCVAGDVLVEEDWSKKSCYPLEASMKRLINEEISKQSNPRRNAPSIVARLMGVDMLPLDEAPMVQPIDKKNESMVMKHSKREKNGRSSVNHFSSISNSSGHMDFGSLHSCKERDVDRWNNGQKLGKQRPREHPQEEELQKFKKEFEAWQAARFKECSKVVELSSPPGQLQENANKQKMFLDANSVMSTSEKPVEHKGPALKGRSREKADRHHKHKLEIFPAERKESFSSMNRSTNINYEHSSLNHDKTMNRSSATKIVILKPGPDRICDLEDSWTSSSNTLEHRGSIEDFLEEVKERLKSELQGKTLKKSSVVRGSGIETPFSEKPSNPKQIARHIAKHVRESVTRDLGMNLLRSESTRSYRSEIQLKGSDSQEFINRGTGTFLSERLRNVLKRGTHSLDVPLVVSGSCESPLLDNEKIRLEEVGDTSQAGTLPSYWEIVRDDQEMQPRSFRHGYDDGVLHRELSPRNLIRSLSAPVSGTSFGKLLLEDRHILTGAHIRRKHESLENVTMESKKLKKERFNIKEKVSNFRYSFALRGRLFGKKLQSMVESQGFEKDFVKEIMSGPPVVRNFGERHIMENSTEVPPSPASVCSSAQEEFWRPVDYLSPVSTSDVTPGEDSTMTEVFKEISSNLNELRRQLSQLESNEPEETTTEQETSELIVVDVEDKLQAYTRDLLVASGLYDGSCDKCFTRWDPLAKPISKSVFEKVEESHRNMAKDNENSNRDENEKKVDHRMLYDLLNEALSSVLGPPVTMSRFRRKITSSSMVPPLRGRKLLESVWEMIRVDLYLPNEKCYHSLDSLVGKNLETSPWLSLMDEEVNDLGKEMEGLIVGDLIEEIVKEIDL